MINEEKTKYLENLRTLYDYVTTQKNILYFNEDFVDYIYSDKSYKFILDFLRRIEFIEIPTINSYNKVKIRNRKDKTTIANNELHKINVNDKEENLNCEDIIYLMYLISDYIESKLIRGGFESKFDTIVINIKNDDFQIQCNIKMQDIIEYINSVKKELFGLHPIKLANEYEERCYEESFYDFVHAIKTLSEYSLSEQYIIRKDNQHLRKKDETTQPRAFDSFDHPAPPKSKDIIKYAYKEDEFKNIIMDFFKKIKFNQIPVIGTGKRVIMIFDSDTEYTSDKSHSLELRFFNGEPYYPDVIYILDKIKDLIMHISDGATNFTFKENSTDFKTIHLKQEKDDFSIDCEIKVEDFIEFSQKLKQYYYEIPQTFPHPNEENSQSRTDEITELNDTFGITEEDRLMDLYTSMYVSLLGYDLRNYFVLFDYDVQDIEWKYFHIEYIKCVEKILGIRYDIEETKDGEIQQFNIKDGICGLISSERFYKSKLIRKDENGKLMGILSDIERHNRLIVEALRNSRAHMRINEHTQRDKIQFQNSLRNTSSNIQGKDDIPNFVISGSIEKFEMLIQKISSEHLDANELIRILNQSETDDKNMTDFEKILPCIEQIEILLDIFSRFQNLTEMDIQDPKILSRYHKAGEVASQLMNVNAMGYIVEKLYSLDKQKNKSR